MSAGRRNGRPLGLPPTNDLSERARQRLRIAARLLRGDGVVIKDTSGFHIGVLAAIGELSEQRRAHLRAQVDWVEDYENAGE